MVLAGSGTVTGALAIGVTFGVAGFADALVQGASFGDALKAGIISGVSAAAFASVGEGFDFAKARWGETAVLSLKFGAIGGITSILQGDKFGHGFVSAGVGAFTGKGLAGSFGKAIGSGGRLAVQMVVGGTLSKTTGGKFANGAVTAAFSAAVQAVAQGATPQQQGGEVEVDYSQLESLEDYQLALDHLNSLQGDPDVNQASLATATSDTTIARSRSRFLQITNVDAAKGVFEVRYAQSQRAVARNSAIVVGGGLVINGAPAAYGGWRALPPHVRRELGAFALDVAAEIFVPNGKLDTSTSPRIKYEHVLPGKLRKIPAKIPR